jgi:hypothetical protein
MAKYSREDFVKIAAALQKGLRDVMRHEKRFEAAAIWYRLRRKGPNDKRLTPSKISKRMTQSINAASKLLRHLEE